MWYIFVPIAVLFILIGLVVHVGKWYFLIAGLQFGFFPKTNMIAWGIITLLTPVIAYFTWYAKGHGWLAIVISSIIIGFFFTQAFSFGMWYLDTSYYDGLISLLL